ncbi:MAG: glucoamylase family protein, partial [Ardenticatenaceae bacterium]
SSLSAYDFGYVGSLGLAPRLKNTLDTMEQLEHHRGHLLNWYDTQRLAPLPPRYVSTVDSGNLAASLWALAQGCLALPRSPVFRWQRWEGFLDTLSVLDRTVARFEEAPGPYVGPDKESGAVEQASAARRHMDNLRRQIHAVRTEPARWVPLLLSLEQKGWPELERLLALLVEAASTLSDVASLRALRLWAERTQHHLHVMRRDIEQLQPWLPLLVEPPVLFTGRSAPAGSEQYPELATAWQALTLRVPGTLPYPEGAHPTLEALPAICDGLLQSIAELEQGFNGMKDTDGANGPAPSKIQTLKSQVEVAGETARRLLDDYRELHDRAQKFVADMDFSFLYDEQRELFHIGYNVDAGRLDDNYYDLLASEARIASLVAIAKEDVPQSHWLHLGRALTTLDNTRALLSWSGTMFEYLMPPLLLRRFEGTLLSQSEMAAVDCQISYARRRGVPWGMSESGYYRFDAHVNYQYRAFGVPDLGFKRGLSDDLVISPYASLLAVALRPREVLENIAALDALRMRGVYGFYEAMDFTPSRLPLGEHNARVQ